MNIQETINGNLPVATSTTTFKKQLKAGELKQIQVYHNNTNSAIALSIEIRDISGGILIPNQNIENLRSRDGSYFSNMPINGKGGNQHEVIITSSAPVNTAVAISVIYDIDECRS